MASVTASFYSCGSGNFSTTITCTGSTCAKLERLAGITCVNISSIIRTCTNNVVCGSSSTVVSSFDLQQEGLNISQTHNITIGNQNYLLTSNGSNFTSVNTTQNTVKKSTGFSLRLTLREPQMRFLVLSTFVVFVAQAFAQSSNDPFEGINNQFSAGFGALLGPLENQFCQNPVPDPAAAVAAVIDCLDLLLQAETDLNRSSRIGRRRIERSSGRSHWCIAHDRGR